MARVKGQFRDVRFEIAFESDAAYFVRFDVRSDRLCKCNLDLIVSSVVGKPLRMVSLAAVAFALGAGYEGLPEYLQGLLDSRNEGAQ